MQKGPLFNIVSCPKISLVYGAAAYSDLLVSLFPACFEQSDQIVYIDTYLEEPCSLINGKRCYFSFAEIQSCLTSEDSKGFQIAIGNDFGYERCEIYRSIAQRGYTIVPLVHATSTVLTSLPINDSVVILPGSVLMPGVSVGICSIVNTSACIDHDTKIGKGCHIMGNAYIAGRVRVGDYTTIGSNSTIFPDIVIGSNCFIGAGSVVNRDVPDNQVVVGNPARFLRVSRVLPKNVHF